MRLKQVLGFILLLIILVFPPTFLAQEDSTSQPSPNRPSPTTSWPPSSEDQSRKQMEKDMAKKANQERQQKLQQDTDKLFTLASELKQYVDKSNENTLSLDVIKKAEEIEKLARSVKDKMKAGY